MGRAARCTVVVVLVLSFFAGVASADVPFEAPAHASRELVGERTAQSRAWEMPSGMRVTQVAPGPVQWQDDQGVWHDVDLSLKAGASGWLAHAGPTDVVLPGKLDAASEDGAVRVVSAGGDTLAMTLLGGAVEGAASDEVVSYRGVLDGVDMELRVVPEGVKEDVVLRDREASRALTYRFVAGSAGLELRSGKDGELLFVRGSDPVFRVPAPVSTDAKGKGSRGTFGVEQIDERTWKVSVRVDEKWLDAKDRAWPVLVDPTVLVPNSFNARLSDDCQDWYPAAFPGTPSCNTGDTRVGGHTTIPPFATSFQAMGVFRWSGFTLDPTDVLDSATLKLYRTGSNSPTTPLKAFRIASSWSDAASLGLLNMPTAGVDLAQVGQFPLGGVGAMQADVSNLVAEWIRFAQTGGVQGVANNGLMLTHADQMGAPGLGYCLSNPCDQTSYASTQNADPTKQPVLELKSFRAAPAGSAILTPEEGQLTGRRVNVQAKALRTSVTTVRWQYIAGSTRNWTDIPVAALRTTDRQSLASNDVPVSGPLGDRRSQMVVWDLSAMPGGDVDGPVHVRAWLDSPTVPSDGGMTQQVNFRLDRRGIDGDSSVEIGPGSVSLRSGEFSMAEKDVSFKGFLQDLTLSRTYASRGVSSRNFAMFGPGWEGSVDADGGDLPYKGIYNYSEVKDVVVDRDQTDPAYDWEDFDSADVEPVQETERWEYHYAVVELGDGSKMTFTQTVDPSGRATGWVPDDQHPGYTLDRASTGTTDIYEFTLSEPSGGIAKFRSEVAKSPNYPITSYRQPGSSSALSYSYEAAGSRQRLKTVTAPVASGPTRSMIFVWGNVGTPSVSRVTSVQVQNGGDTPITVAQYDYDTQGRLIKETDPRIAGGVRNTQYHYDTGGRLDQITSSGEAAWNLTYAQVSGDAGWRLATVSRAHPDGGTATNTLLYDVPVNGSGAPYDLSAREAARWGQDDIAWDAVAIFPQDTIPDPRAPDYTRATIHYFDVDGREVNVAKPGGGVSTTEYDANGNVHRSLSAQGRAVALAAGSGSVAVAQDRSTLYSYSGDGVDLNVTREPVTSIQLSDGSTVRGRRMSIMRYDEGTPGGTFHLLTSKWTAVEQASDQRQLDAREKVDYFYDANGGGDGWRARHVTKTVVDPGGRALTSYSILHPDYPIVEQTRTPEGAAGGNTPDVQYFQYYGITPSSSVPAVIRSGTCNLTDTGHIPGQLCERSEGTGGIASVPRRLYTYDAYANITSIDETRSTVLIIGSDHRRTSYTFDGAAQLTDKTITDGVGTATPSVTYGYTASTGRQTTAASSNGTITRAYDSNGRLSQYTDAAGTVSTFRYDLRGRRTSATVAGSTITNGYDNRDNLTSVTDPGIGSAVTASYDLDDNLVSETMPNGLVMIETYDETNRPAAMSWTQTRSCSSNCTWARSTILSRDTDGRITARATGNTQETLVYDGVGRLTRDDAVKLSDTSCVRKTYTYDNGAAGDSNRTSTTTWTGAARGACGTGTTSTRALTYDQADRVSASGWVWDDFGRATTVPSSDSGGTGALTAGYYTDDHARLLTLDSRTQTYTRDALDRTKTVASSGAGKPSFTETYRYSDDTDEPAKITISTGSTSHDIEGPSGQIVANNTDGTLTYSLRDLQGSIVGIAPASGTPRAATEYDPFGIVTTGTPNVIDWTFGDPGYGWLGTHQRTTDFGQTFVGAAGPIEMGARVLLPRVGRFLQTDPIDGGAANAYDYALQDPIDVQDLGGRNVIDTAKGVVKTVISEGKAGWRYGGRLLGGANAAYCGITQLQRNTRENAKHNGVSRLYGFWYFFVDDYNCMKGPIGPTLHHG